MAAAIFCGSAGAAPVDLDWGNNEPNGNQSQTGVPRLEKTDSFAIASATKKSKAIHDSRVTAASYSTGEQGAKLKWLPYRPTKSTGKPHGKTSSARPVVVQRAEFHEQASPSLNAADDPLNNPFGDNKRPFGDAKRESDVHKIARARGPNARGPLLRPIAAGKDTMPLPGLSKKENEKLFQTAPKLLLPQSSDKDDGYNDGSGRKIPTVEEELASNPQRFMDACPPKGSFKSISELSDNVTAKKGKFPRECNLAKEVFKPRAWTPTTFAWTASGMCHKPLYFEQPQVERYGHSWGPYLQPLISGGHFFVTVPILPYKMGMYPPGECMYSLGYYRPGSCAPYMLDPFPLSVRGGLIQAGTVVGAAAIIP